MVKTILLMLTLLSVGCVRDQSAQCEAANGIYIRAESGEYLCLKREATIPLPDSTKAP